MNGKAPASGLKGYLGALVATLLFPLAWMRSMALARRHTDVDPRGPAKVAAAIVIGVVVVAGGIFVLFGFQDAAEDGMYNSLDSRLQIAVGEKEVRENEETVQAADNTMNSATTGIADALASYAANRSALVDSELETPRLDRLESLWADVRSLDQIEDSAIAGLPVRDQDALYNLTFKVQTGLNDLEAAAVLNQVAIVETQTALGADRKTVADLEAKTNRTPAEAARLLDAQASVIRNEQKLSTLLAERSALLLKIDQARSALLTQTRAAVTTAGQLQQWTVLRQRVDAAAAELGFDSAMAASGQSLVTVLRDDFLATLAAAVADDQAAGSDRKAKADSALEESKRAFLLSLAIDRARADSARASYRVEVLAPNRALYSELAPAIDDQDDDRIQSLVDQADLAYPADMSTNVRSALAIKDEAVSDMHLSLWLFVWPSLAGMFFAPLAFALGSILRNTFVESDTVGFKPYPGGAAGWFLLFGAFGLPSIPFAAWVFMDAENRSVEGQIAL